MLLSRKITKEDFVKEFLKTLKAGVIKRSEFIDWDKINEKYSAFSFELDFFSELISMTNIDKLAYLRDSLLSSDEPYKLIKLCFGLLAHTPNQYVSWEDNINIKKYSEEIKGGSIEKADNLIELLRELGFLKILTLKNISNYFRGILVGLETHRRKNADCQCAF